MNTGYCQVATNNDYLYNKQKSEPYPIVHGYS